MQRCYAAIQTAMGPHHPPPLGSTLRLLRVCNLLQCCHHLRRHALHQAGCCRVGDGDELGGISRRHHIHRDLLQCTRGAGRSQTHQAAQMQHQLW